MVVQGRQCEHVFNIPTTTKVEVEIAPGAMTTIIMPTMKCQRCPKKETVPGTVTRKALIGAFCKYIQNEVE